MSENVPAVPNQGSKYVSADITKQFSTGFKFLPRIQVAGGLSDIVKKKQINMGRIALVDGKIVTDLGENLVAFIVSWRPKALRYEGGSATVSYNPDAALFKDIRAAADVGGQNNPNNYGPEFYLWLPDYKRTAGFFHGNTTLRNEAPIGLAIYNEQVQKQLWLPVQFTIDLIEKKRANQSWYSTRISPYNVEISVDKLPPMDTIQDELNRFNNPKEQDDVEKPATEPVGADGSGRER